jgi:flagellar assembly protein FliH
MEREMAEAVARIATELARQVVRSELAARPELVAKVAEDAVNAVLHSARHVRISVHPDDQPLVAQGAAEALEARGARLTASPAVPRGGCVVESDVGSIDARIATRWSQAAAALGQSVPYSEDEA